MSIILYKMINSEDLNVNVNEDNKMISLCVQMNGMNGSIFLPTL